MSAALQEMRRRVRRLLAPPPQPDKKHAAPVRLLPETRTNGRVLVSYSSNVYQGLLQGKALDRTHVSALQNFNITRTFLDLGFNVDVFHFEDREYLPQGSYDVIVDIVSNLGRLADSQGPETVKILYPMFAHWTVHNLRSYERHRALAERRGVAISPKRLLAPNDSVERADHILCIGGAFGRGTYAYSRAPVTPVTPMHPHAIDEFIDRDFAACRRNFVWMGGRSAVHKGLDLVLEAFAELPDYGLTVLGKVPEERRFAEVYQKELFGLPNIRVAGWVDTMSDTFRDIVSKAGLMVAPSATEMSCGSVIAGMMNGLVPITTESTDIDMAGIGFSIETGSVAGVRDAVIRAAETSPAALGELSHAARTASGQRYGGERFIRSFRAAVCGALGLEPPPAWDRVDDVLRVPTIEMI